MKKIFSFFLSFFFSVVCFNNLNAQLGAFRLRHDAAIQLGYINYKYLTFGQCTGGSQCPQYNNGSWSIEYWDNGLNFWKPWPSENAGNYKMFIHNKGNVGINMKPNPNHSRFVVLPYPRTIRDFKLQVKGYIVSNGTFTWSDERLKENVNDLNIGLSEIMKLNPVSYIFKSDEVYGASVEDFNEDTVKNNTINEDFNAVYITEPKYHYGFLANQIQQVLPNLVEEVDSITLAVNYVELIPIMVKALQEQQVLIEFLQSQIKQISNSNTNSNNIKGKLYPNEPNPFNSQTKIPYDIYVDFTKAEILIFDFWAKKRMSFNLNDSFGEVFVNRGSLESGTYHYVLVLDDSVVDSKIMLVY